MVTSPRIRERSRSRGSKITSSKFWLQLMLLLEALTFQISSLSFSLSLQKIPSLTSTDLVELLEQATQELASPSSTVRTKSS